MITKQPKTLEEYSRRIINTLDVDLLIPKVFLEKEWTIRNTKNYAFYITRPYPIFFIDALYDMFRDAFIKKGINPDGDILTSGSPRHMPTKKKRVIKEKKKFTPTWAGGNVKNPKMFWKHLVVRWKENSVTLEYWNRSAKLYMFKDGELSEKPSDFMYNILKNLNYPMYAVKDAIRKKLVKKLVKIINIIKVNNLRGWRIDL